MSETEEFVECPICGEEWSPDADPCLTTALASLAQAERERDEAKAELSHCVDRAMAYLGTDKDHKRAGTAIVDAALDYAWQIKAERDAALEEAASLRAALEGTINRLDKSPVFCCACAGQIADIGGVIRHLDDCGLEFARRALAPASEEGADQLRNASFRLYDFARHKPKCSCIRYQRLECDCGFARAERDWVEAYEGESV